VVICPGAWAPQLLAEFDIPITVERQVLYWLDPIGGTAAFENQPIFIDENAAGMQVYGFPAIDGPTGGVKVAFFRKGIVCTPDTIDRVVHPGEITEMRDRVGALLPALDGPCLHSATCMYSNTPDEHFVIARHPDSSNVTVACGFSGHGFKFVPVVGEILADLAMTGTTNHPIALFDPRRLATL
jgi:sarcosine oxidase